MPAFKRIKVQFLAADLHRLVAEMLPMVREQTSVNFSRMKHVPT